jgi:hypothetical protein
MRTLDSTTIFEADVNSRLDVALKAVVALVNWSVLLVVLLVSDTD